jgi:hypothetical protein
LIALINTEKNKEGSRVPYYPPYGGGDGDSGKESSPDQGGKKPDGKGEEGKKPTTGGDKPTGSKGEEIVEELSLQKIDSNTVNDILDEISTTTTTTSEDEKNANTDRIKEKLKIIEQALNKKEYNEMAEFLHKQLEEISGSSLVFQSAVLNQQVAKAIKHLEMLKNKENQIQNQPQLQEK